MHATSWVSAIALALCLAISPASGQTAPPSSLEPANVTADLYKCNSGYRDFCPPIVRCWFGVEEVACNGPDSDETLFGAWIHEPARHLSSGEMFWVGWDIGFKNQSRGGRFKNPWVEHTNVHVAPADVGALAPPSNHPLRKDSESLTGGAGHYWTNMTLFEGVWLIMAHIRIEDLDNPGLKYEMTVDIVRTVGNVTEAVTAQNVADTERNEKFCGLFSNCDNFRRVWIASFSGLVTLFFLIWLQSFFFTERMSIGSLSLRIEAKRLVMMRFAFAISLASLIIMTNDKFLQRWIHTNREPSRIATKTNDPLQFPNVLLCPFTATGTIKVLSAVHYPNLYGLSAHQVSGIAEHEIDLSDSRDGTSMRRNCFVVDMAAHHRDINVDVTSEFTTLMIKTIVTDPVRTDTGGFGDALAVMFDKTSDLDNIQKFTINQIVLGQTFATYTSLSPRIFKDVNGNVSESFGFTTNAISNPYLRNSDDLCKTASSDGQCMQESVLVINWKTLQTELVYEEPTLDFFTVMTVMVGVISGCRMALEVVTNFVDHLAHKTMDQEFVVYIIGHPEPEMDILNSSSHQDFHRRGSFESVSGISIKSGAGENISIEVPTAKPKPFRANLTEIMEAFRTRKLAKQSSIITKAAMERRSLEPLTDIEASDSANQIVLSVPLTGRRDSIRITRITPPTPPASVTAASSSGASPVASGGDVVMSTAPVGRMGAMIC